MIEPNASASHATKGVTVPHDGRPNIVLLPTLADDGGPSMNRFSRELLAELRTRQEIDIDVAGPVSTRLGLRTRRDARIWRGWMRFVAYPRCVRRMSGDAYHVLDQGYSHLVAFLPPERVIATCHDVMPLRAEATGAPFRVSRLTRTWYELSVSFLRRVAHVACVSEATRRDLVRWVGVDPSRTSVVPSGVSRQFRVLSRRERQIARTSLPMGTRLVLHVSSGATYKNVEGTLEVVACLLRDGIPTTLVRVGTPLNADQRATARRLRVLGSVLELGSVSDARLVEIYNAADALIFPSHWEGFGWPAAEALACGLPTVVSNCEALLETVGGAALSASGNDPMALAAAVRQIWDVPQLRTELRERGIARAADLSWRRAGDRYVALYEGIVAAGNCATATKF